VDERHIAAAVRREVYEREGGRCAYVGEGGRRCEATHLLEYQHIVPVARGGRSRAENLTLFCQPHNLLQAVKDFGEDHVRGKQLERRAVSGLIELGYKRGQAEQAVRAAVRRLAGGSALAVVLQESLRILVR
jgi:hypothetical protein